MHGKTELRLVSEGAPLRDQPDDVLMGLARKGSEEAFDTLVRRHQSAALQMAVRHMGTVTAAEDVVQEAFAELYRYLPQYRPEGKLKVLLFRILLNRARMAHRSWRRARLLLVAPPERIAPPLGEVRLLEQERRRRVQKAISRLPERYRAVVTLRFGGELSYAEIGDTLDIPVGTVKSRMFTALAKLRKRLEEER